MRFAWERGLRAVTCGVAMSVAWSVAISLQLAVRAAETDWIGDDDATLVSFDEVASASDAGMVCEGCDNGNGCYGCEPSCGQAGCGAHCGAGVGRDCPRFWFRGDYLAWQLTGSDLPPLATGSPLGTPLATAGEFGQPTTTVLFGGEEVGNDWRNGYQVSGGYWLDPCRGWALVGDYFALGRDSANYLAGPDANQIITRPYFNAQSDVQDAQFVDALGEVDGSLGVRAYDDFSGAGLGTQLDVWSRCGARHRRATVAVVAGYRFYQHDSALQINENLTIASTTTQPLVPGTTIVLEDRFAARNEFHGGEIGLQGRLQADVWWFDGLAMMAVGGNRRSVSIDGSTVNSVPNAGSATLAGGLLTSSETNIGDYSDTQAVVIPRFRLGVGCQLTERLSLRTGYNVILWNGLVQASSHLPPGLQVDPRNLPPVDNGGGPEPAFPGLTGTSFVAHGIDAGLQLDF